MKLPMSAATWKIIETVNDLTGYYLVGLSGGADSLVLTQAAQFVATRKNSRLKIGVIIINHNLQEVNEVIENTIQQVQKMGIETIIVKSVTVEDGNMENNARIARYQAFNEALRETGAKGILLGHNQDDQAEQFFLGLLRGSGLRSISGIKGIRDKFLRPFLNITREEILEAAETWKLTYWSDPHNENCNYSRVNIRKNIIPTIKKELGEAAVNNLIKTMKMAEEDNEALDFIVKEKLGEVAVFFEDRAVLAVRAIEELPKALRTRIIHHVLNCLHSSYHKSATILKIDELFFKKGAIAASKVEVTRKGELLVFRKAF